MDRYQQIIKKETLRLKPQAYQFRTSNSIIRVSEYLLRCMIDGVAFDAYNINSAILDGALIRASKISGCPIVVGSDTLEKALRMTYGTRKIYSPKTIPSSVYRVICYHDLDKKDIDGKEVVLKIIRNKHGNS